jgi:hypothetical protein
MITVADATGAFLLSETWMVIDGVCALTNVHKKSSVKERTIRLIEVKNKAGFTRKEVI